MLATSIVAVIRIEEEWMVPSHPNVEPQIQREHRSYIYPAPYSPCKYDVRILRYDFLVLKINRRIETVKLVLGEGFSPRAADVADI